MSSDLLKTRLGELSERMRFAREARGYSLGELSERSSVAPSTILKIENRQMIPSVAVIMKIAIGLDVGVADLIAPARTDPIDIVEQRAGRHGRLQTSDDLFFEQLSSSSLRSDLHLWRVRIKPFGKVRFLRPQPFDEMIAVGEAGSIEMSLGRETYLLNVGDSIHVLKRSLVRLRNLGAEPASYIVTGTLPKAKLLLPVASNRD